jgi:pyruvate decarboxylase
MTGLFSFPFGALIDFDRYTIERMIHGMVAKYNDIQPMRYTELPSAMGAKPGQCKTFQVKTKKELIALWASDDLTKGKGLRFVEVMMPMKDAPALLITTSVAAAKGIGGDGPIDLP